MVGFSGSYEEKFGKLWQILHFLPPPLYLSAWLAINIHVVTL